MIPEFSLEGVLAHRVVVQDLATPVRAVRDCRLLGLGLQDTPRGSGVIGLSVRTTQPASTVTRTLADEGPLAVVMAARGAPHVVSRAELPLITAALSPFDEQEAAEVQEVADAMREIVRGAALSRPALSEALNDKVTNSVRSWCERCGSRHVREGLFRKATLQAGLMLDPDKSTHAHFVPSGIAAPTSPDRDVARAELVRRYIHLTGVARPADLASWLGYKTGEIRRTWNLVQDELTQCSVAGTKRWSLTADAEAMSDLPPARGAKLLPTSDPYLLGDRSLVVPEPEHRHQVFRPIGSPGTLLLDGEVVGTWRHKMDGTRLHVDLMPFDAIADSASKQLAREAEQLASLRQAADVIVTIANSTWSES